MLNLMTTGNNPKEEAAMIIIPQTEIQINRTLEEIEDPNRYDPIRSEDRLRVLIVRQQRQKRLAEIVWNIADLMKSWMHHFQKKNVARAS